MNGHVHGLHVPPAPHSVFVLQSRTFSLLQLAEHVDPRPVVQQISAPAQSAVSSHSTGVPALQAFAAVQPASLLVRQHTSVVLLHSVAPQVTFPGLEAIAFGPSPPESAGASVPPSLGAPLEPLDDVEVDPEDEANPELGELPAPESPGVATAGSSLPQPAIVPEEPKAINTAAPRSHQVRRFAMAAPSLDRIPVHNSARCSPLNGG